MKKLPKHIKVKITEKDVKQSKGYTSNSDCYLATALKRKKFKDVQVYAMDASIDGTTYVMSALNSDKLAHLQFERVFKPFVVTLTKRFRPIKNYETKILFKSN